MEPLFALSIHDINNILSSIKSKLMLGIRNVQVSAVEQILTILKTTDISERDIIVEQLIKFDIITCMCDAMQTSNESYIKIVLEFFEFISVYKQFYENHTAVIATESMLRLCYCMSKLLNNSTLFQELVQSICNILVRSFKLTANLYTACVPQQIVFFVKNLDIQDSQEDKVKFSAAKMLSVVLRQETFNENVDEEMMIDICRDVLKSMVEIIKCGNDNNTILSAATLLCNISAGSCRFCFESDFEEEKRSEVALKICQKRDDLSIHIYNTIMDVIIPFVKNADLFRVDSVELYGNLVSCLNSLYQLRNCNCDNLSNNLAADGYLKYFLHLTVRLPDNLQRNVCILLSRILSILGKTTLYEDTIKLENNLHQGLLNLPKDSTERWSDVLTYPGKDGTVLTILLYYHFLGTREIDVSLQSLVARIMMLPKSTPVSVPILKPLWFLFAVSSVSQSYSNFVDHYENAVNLLMCTLQRLDISKFYTHHIDLLRYCLKCQYVPQSVINQVLNLWLIQSDGDIKPLLSFNCDKVVRHLLVVIQTGYPKDIIRLAVKGIRYLIEISKQSKHIADCIADIVWHILPNVLSSCQTNTVAHIETVLELSNIIQPHIVPIHIILRSADSIANIMLKKIEDPKFMNLVVEQANILLMSSLSRKSLKVLEMYIQKPMLLEKLYVYGFSKDRSQFSVNSIKLLAFIMHSQKKSSLKCQQALMIHIKSLLDLLTYTLKALSCAIYEIQFVCELLTQNTDGLAIILQEIVADTDDMYALLNLYEILHTIHAQKDPIQKDAVHQGLVAVLRFCNIKLIKSLPYLCTTMSNYDLIFNIVKMQHVSCQFVEFVTTWLYYRKANCKDVLWNPRSLGKTPFDEVLDHLKEYSVIIKDKGLKDAYLSLTDALSQFK